MYQIQDWVQGIHSEENKCLVYEQLTFWGFDSKDKNSKNVTCAMEESEPGMRNGVLGEG